MTVYFIGCGNAVKIGYTESAIEKRMNLLQTGNPCKLELLCTVDGNSFMESKLHGMFSHLLLRGEWYAATPELLEFIDLINEHGSLDVEPEEKEKRMDTKQAGEYIGVSPQYVCVLCKSGKLKAKKVMGRCAPVWRISIADAQTYKEARAKS